MPPLLAASSAVQLAIDGRSGRSAGGAGALFSHTRYPTLGHKAIILEIAKMIEAYIVRSLWDNKAKLY